MANVRQAWADFLNPDMVRGKFISAGLFLVAHETLLDSIKRHPLSFFADSFTKDGPKPSPKYTREVLELDPKGKMDAHRGSVAWLRKCEVIDADDEALVRRVKDQRNQIAHELSGMMAGQVPPDYLDSFGPLVALISKLEKWWIVNVHMDIMDDDLPSDGDVERVMPGVIMSLDMLSQVALGEGADAWELHRLFEDLWPASRKTPAPDC